MICQSCTGSWSFSKGSKNLIVRDPPSVFQRLLLTSIFFGKHNSLIKGWSETDWQSIMYIYCKSLYFSLLMGCLNITYHMKSSYNSVKDEIPKPGMTCGADIPIKFLSLLWSHVVVSSDLIRCPDALASHICCSFKEWQIHSVSVNGLVFSNWYFLHECFPFGPVVSLSKGLHQSTERAARGVTSNKTFISTGKSMSSAGNQSKLKTGRGRSFWSKCFEGGKQWCSLSGNIFPHLPPLIPPHGGKR